MLHFWKELYMDQQERDSAFSVVHLLFVTGAHYLASAGIQ